MNIKNITSSSLVRGGMIFFIGGIITNVLNYLFRILMGRMLGPEAFGELIVIISLVLVLAVPSGPIQTAAARFSALFEAEESPKKIKLFLRYLTKIITSVGLGVVFFIVIFAKNIQNFLKLSSTNYVYFLGGIVVIMLLSGIIKGVLQGLKRFVRLTSVFILESGGRVGLGVLLVALGLGLGGALEGYLMPLILAYFLAIYFLWDIVRLDPESKILNQGNSSSVQRKEIWQYVFYSFLAFLFLNILLNADIILVKHYFSGFEAGIYSSFATLGRGVFIATGLLGGVMFPLVVSKQAKEENYFSPLKIVSLISLIVAGLVALLFFLFSKELFLLFFGKEYLEGAAFLGYYGIVMGLMGFIFLLSSFFMALNEFKFLYILAIGSILEISLISIWHATFWQVISMFSVALSLTLLSMISLIFLDKKALKLA